MAESPAARIATNLRVLRTQRDLSIVELAKRSGVARATLTKIEAGNGNPTIDTLYALADALDAALGDLIGTPPAARVRVVRAGEGTRTKGAVAGRLLDRITGMRTADVYDITFTRRRAADPHPAGVVESLALVSGRLLTGPVADPVELGPGDFVRFPGDVPHLYQAVGGPATAILVISQP
jgi:transcriptional regulator with XRE-family HTH domain